MGGGAGAGEGGDGGDAGGHGCASIVMSSRRVGVPVAKGSRMHST